MDKDGCNHNVTGKSKNNHDATDKSESSHDATDKRLYTIKELAAEIGGTVWYWRSQIWDRKLPYVQVGRKMLVDRKDIDVFIDTNKVMA